MVIDEIKDYLVANTSLVFGQDLWIGNMPDSKQSCVVLSNTNLEGYQYNLNDNFATSNEQITIRVRGTEKENIARALAQTVQNTLENLKDTALGSKRLIRGVFETPMYQLDGTDENNNFVYVGIYSALVE